MNLRLKKRTWQSSQNSFETIDNMGQRVYLTLEMEVIHTNETDPNSTEGNCQYSWNEWVEVPIVDEYV